jgi:N-acyl-L-homoserine lactone synthetase
MLTFDASNRDLCSVKSQQTNTPLQALVLLNDPQIIEASRVLAEKASKKEANITEQLAYMYLAATGQFATDKVAAQLLDLYRDMELQVQQEGVLPEAYLSIGEKATTFKEKNTALTALSLTAHTILNLDLTITRS